MDFSGAFHIQQNPVFLLKLPYQVTGDIAGCCVNKLFRWICGGFLFLSKEANAEELTLKLYWEGPGHCGASEYWLMKETASFNEHGRVSKMKGSFK